MWPKEVAALPDLALGPDPHATNVLGAWLKRRGGKELRFGVYRARPSTERRDAEISSTKDPRNARLARRWLSRRPALTAVPPVTRQARTLDLEVKRLFRHGYNPSLLRHEGRLLLAYRWHAYDYETRRRRPLYEPIGGFWIGCSIEGLMALGTVRFFERGRIETAINGARYEIELYRSPDGRSLRTFFPRFRGLE